MNNMNESSGEREIMERFLSANQNLTIIVDQHTRFLKTNCAWEKTLGYSEEELQRKNLFGLVHPQETESFYEELKSIKEQQAFAGITRRFRHKDGTYRSIEIWGYFKDECYYMVAKDVSDIVKMQKAMEESEKNFHTFFETIDDMVFVADKSGEILYVNQTAVEKLGYARDALIGMKIIDIHPEVYREEASAIIRDMLGGIRNYCPLPIQKKNGEFLPVETRITFGTWNGKNCIYGISKDLSKQQAALDKFQKFFNNNPSLMAVTRISDYTISDVNKAFLEKLGFEKEEVIGKKGSEIGIVVPAGNTDDLARELAETGMIESVELDMKNRDGEILHGVFSCTRIDNQGEVSYLSVFTDITEQKDMEMKLHAARENMQVILDNLPAMAWMKDEEGRFIDVNKEFVRYSGRELHEIIGHTDFDVWEKELARHCSEEDQKVMESREKQTRVFKCCKDGNVKWFETHKSPIFGRGRKVIGLTGIIQDVTDRKEMEINLEMEKRFTDQMLNAIPDILFYKDVKGRYIGFNKAFEDQFPNQTREEIMGKTDRELMWDPEDAEYFVKTDKAVLEQGKQMSVEDMVTKLNGEARIIETKKVPFYNNDGQIGGILGVARDITTHKAMKEELRESEERFRQLFENMTNGFSLNEVVYDQEGKPCDCRYLLVNRAYEKATGRAGSSIVGKTYSEVMEGIDEKRIQDYCRVAISGKPMTLERSVSGEDKIISEFVYSPRKDQFAIIYEDITERKKLDEALIEAKQNAEQANKAKDRFLATMSHEIRTPMNGILGFLQLLEKTELTREQRGYVDNMKTSSNLLHSVIDDILDFSKMEARGVELENIPFNLHDVAEDAVIPFAAAAFNKEIDINLYIEPGTPEHVTGDPTRLKQVVANLMNNAVKFTDSGSVSVTISKGAETEESYEILFKVEDTGIGIPGEVIPKLFKPFNQADSSTIRRFGGTGLGLSISKTLVEAMGGTIGVDSVPNKGSIFCFTVRLGRRVGNLPVSLQEMDEYKVLKDKKVMLVSGNIRSRGILASYLREIGMGVIELSEGSEAIAELMQSWKGRVHAVVMSDRIQDMDTEDLSVALKSISMTKDIPQIIVASKMSNADGAGIAGRTTLPKPFRKRELLSVMAEEIEKSLNRKAETETGEPREEISRKESEKSIYSEKPGILDGGNSSQRKQRILVVDDILVNIQLLIAALEKDYEIIPAANGKEAIRIAHSENKPDLVLLDVMMPEMNGYEVCQWLSEDSETKDIPVIFLTAMREVEDEEYGLKLGAVDYITKPFSIPIVKLKVKNQLAIKKYENQLKENSRTDPLTGIANRRRFDETFEVELRRARRMGTCFSVLIADIDHFKNYNDAYGHLAGDDCLCLVAGIIRDSLRRPADLAARWGGEEFVCLLPDTDRKGAAVIGEMIRQAVMDLAIPHKDSKVAEVVTVSIGSVTSDPKEESDYEKLMERADQALYAAKGSGRNRVCSWDQVKDGR